MYTMHHHQEVNLKNENYPAKNKKKKELFLSIFIMRIHLSQVRIDIKDSKNIRIFYVCVSPNELSTVQINQELHSNMNKWRWKEEHSLTYFIITWFMRIWLTSRFVLSLFSSCSVQLLLPQDKREKEEANKTSADW